MVLTQCEGQLLSVKDVLSYTVLGKSETITHTHTHTEGAIDLSDKPSHATPPIHTYSVYDRGTQEPFYCHGLYNQISSCSY